MADCYNKITNLPEDQHKAIFGDNKIPKDALRRFVDDLEQLKAAAAKNGEFGTLGKRMNEYVKSQKELSKISKMVRKQDLLKARALDAYLNQPAFMKDPFEGLRSKISASTKLGIGSRDSAEFHGYAMARDVRNSAVAQMMKDNTLKMFQSNQNAKNIWIETRALGENRNIGVTKDAEAMKIAKVIHNTNKKMLQMQRKMGIPLRELPEYVVPATHDIDVVRKAGVDKWVSDVMNMDLDRKAVFGVAAGNSTVEKEILADIYKSITLGKNGIDTELTVQDFDDNAFGRNLTKSLTQSRILKFNSAEGEFNYNQAYGKANLSELFTKNIDRKTRMMGLIKVFGSNPEQAIESALQRTKARLMRSGQPELANSLKDNENLLWSRYKEVSGQASAPGLNTLAKVSRGIRTMETLAMLWDSGLRSAGNFPMAALQIKNQVGGNYLSHLGGVVWDFLKTTPYFGDKRAAKHLGFFLSDFNTGINENFGVGSADSLSGKAAKAQFMLNGMDYINQRVHYAHNNRVMGHFADAAMDGWEKADPRVKASFLSMGLQKEDFEIMKHAIEEMPDGRMLMTAEGIDKIPKDMVQGRVMEYNANLPKGFRSAGKMTAATYLDDLKYKYLGFMQQGGMDSSTSAGAFERGIITGGTARGTWEGETRRFVGLFKSIWFQQFKAMKMAANSTPDMAMLERGELMSKGTDYKTLAQFAVASVGTAYMSQALIDYSKGKAIRDPRHLSTWIDAVQKSSLGAFFTDVLAEDADKFGGEGNLLGPVLGQAAGPGFKFAARAVQEAAGQEPSKGPQLENMGLRLIRNNMPFQRAWGLKQGYDYLFNHVLTEYLNPGYEAKRENRNRLAEKKQNRL